MNINDVPKWLRPPLKDEWMTDSFSDNTLFYILSSPPFEEYLNLIKDHNYHKYPIMWAGNGDKCIQLTDNVQLLLFNETGWMVNPPKDAEPLREKVFIELRLEKQLRVVYIPETHFYLIPHYFFWEKHHVHQKHYIEHLPHKKINGIYWNLEIYCL